jgi:hypothetical protein
MLKTYLPTENKFTWDRNTDRELFRTKKGELFQTDNPKIQKFCEEYGYEEIKETESDTLTETEIEADENANNLTDTEIEADKNASESKQKRKYQKR